MYRYHDTTPPLFPETMATTKDATSEAGELFAGHGVSLNFIGEGSFGQVEHRFLPATECQTLTFVEKYIVKPYLESKQFLSNFFCCRNDDLVGDWEFDILARREIKARWNDDVEFTDLAKLGAAYSNANRAKTEMYERAVRSQPMSGVDPYLAHRIHSAVSCNARMNAERAPVFADRKSEWERFTTKHKTEKHTEAEWDALFAENRFDVYGNTIVVETKPSSQDLQDMSNIRVYELRKSAGTSNSRRRRRVIAHCVVALINRVRAKYFRLENTNANKRMVASYLLKLMREHNFRTADIHLHVSYAVDLYFESADCSVTAAARA